MPEANPLTADQFTIVAQDMIDALPDTLTGLEIASLLSTIACSYTKNEADAVFHLTQASYLLQQESRE